VVGFFPDGNSALTGTGHYAGQLTTSKQAPFPPIDVQRRTEMRKKYFLATEVNAILASTE